ncbi:toxin biosynthesis protein-like protein [Venturia nashicola]|uniref:Toxin biosynthesis protein-like protein n=1 Tax=Venturia nashicola TaxID=86259 RepID=A0A4Z1NNJ8_9PEZI|nr:toxin biosynthesis protein-like protein [Venturia nashicola]TLD26080.1 toxin biosynthesis protein-like protein [Venturia nashicola]
MNLGHRSDATSWFDHARDYLAVVNHFRDQMPRPIIGFGHSMGGVTMINLALIHPRLLTSIITVEPIINKTTEGMHFGGLYPINFKKDKWPSHEAAARSILKSPFYKSWDLRIRELYTKHGFSSLPTKHHPAEEGVKAVTTTTTKAQEILSFGKGAYPPNQKGLSLDEWTPDPLRHPDLGEWRDKGNACYRPESIITFAQLQHLRPSIFYVVGDKSPMYSSSPSGRADVLAATSTGVGGSVEGGNHLLVMEQPTHMAEEIVGPRIGEEMKKWAETERRELAEWEKWEESKRGQIDTDWEWWMKERHSPKGPKNMDKKAKL